jgi:hypothetical protein
MLSRQRTRLGRLESKATAPTLLVVAVVTSLSACGSGSTPASTTSSATSGSAPGAVPPGNTPAASFHGKLLPGVREFGFTDQEFTDKVERTESLVASCMKDAGFEYVPVDVNTVISAQKRVRTEPGYTRKTYKQKWGLAVTTRFDDPVRDTGLGPNLAILKALPQTDQNAYLLTLLGADQRHTDFVWTLDEEDFSPTGGCTRKAVQRVFTPDQLKGTYVNPKDVLLDADKRIVAAREAWSKCMADAGYQYAKDQDEIISEYGDQLDNLLKGDDPQTLTGSRAAALHTLQQEEIKVSLADLNCQIKHTDKVFDQVETEVYGQPLN